MAIKKTAGFGRVPSGEYVHESRLARTVCSDDADPIALIYMKRNLVQYHIRPVCFYYRKVRDLLGGTECEACDPDGAYWRHYEDIAGRFGGAMD